MTLLLRPWLDSLTIKTSNLEYKKLDLDTIDPDPTIGDWGWAQRPFVAEVERQYNLNEPVRIIVLKARQLGISTITEALLFLWAFIHQGTNGAVVSHTDGQAQQLFEMTKRYWETWPHKVLFAEKYHTRRQIQWKETQSNLRVVTAQNSDSLRGSTLHAVHASEVAFWDNAEVLWGGLEPSIPNRHGTFVCLESTANGIGNWFHEEWERAQTGDSAFIPLFFPWYRHSATRIFGTSLSRTDLDTEERHILKLMQKEGFNDETIYASLSFRQIEVRKKGEDWFHQEYPTTPEEAFITTGNPIFNRHAVDDCTDIKRGAVGYLYRNGRGEVVFAPDPSGPLTIFRPPHDNPDPNRYFVGGDPARSESMTADPSCAQVIHRSRMEQVAVWHGQCDPVQFAKEMMLMGDFYGGAMLAPEVEGGGMATIGAIITSGYPNIWNWKKGDRTTNSSNTWGWLTSYGTKRWAISEMENLLNTRSLLIHDRQTYQEILNFVEHPNGDIGNAGRKKHDDTVMALAIAVTASKSEGFYNPRATRRSYAPDIFTSELEGGEQNIVDLATAVKRHHERVS
jgi:hypothetical protein